MNGSREDARLLFPRSQQQRDFAKAKRAEMQAAGQWFRHMKQAAQLRERRKQ